MEPSGWCPGVRVIGSNDEPAWLDGIFKTIGTDQGPVPGPEAKERLPRASVEDLAEVPKFTADLSTTVTPAALVQLTPGTRTTP